jgi:hypothetical protein
MKRLTKVAVWLGCAGSLVTAAPAFADHVKLEDLPPAARKTVVRETQGATIQEIDKDTDKAGKPVYEVEYKKAGVEWELKVAPGGAIIEQHKD